MAESQRFFDYTEEAVAELKRHLSQQRFNTYVKQAGYNEELAFLLYLYNARLSKAFLFPLQVFEVFIRNGIDSVLSSVYSDNWHCDIKFVQVLTEENRRSLEIAKAKAFDLNKQEKGDVISLLTLGFWSNLFRSEYDRPIWQTNLHHLFPNNLSLSRNEFSSRIKEINRLRNRIAHHEPIIKEDVSRLVSSIIDIVGWGSSDLSKWVRAHNTVHKIIRTRPRDGGDGNTLDKVCDSSFDVIDCELDLTSCDRFSKFRFLIGFDMASNQPQVVLDQDVLGKYVLGNLESGMIDFSDHKIRDLSPLSNWTTMQAKNSIVDLNSSFKSNDFVVVLDEKEELLGVIKKAHRRY